MNGRAGIRLAQRGFSLLELALVILVLSVLSVVLAKSLFIYREQAEKAAMLGVEAAVQTALVLQYGHLLANNAEADIPALAIQNPMQWMSVQPANYAGEFYDPSPAAIEPGSWVFDLKTRELIYFPARSSYLEPDPAGLTWIRFHVELQTSNDQYASSEAPPGVRFKPIKPYQWSP